MAGFRKDHTTAAQTSANAAGVVVGAMVAKGITKDAGEAADAVVVIFDALFERISPIVDSDNALFAEVDAAQAASKPAKNTTTTGDKAYTVSRGGTKGKSSGGAAFKGDLGDALSLVLNFGAFEGKTLEDLKGIDADDASENYGYRDGDADGTDYLKWLAGAKQKNGYVQGAARLVADDAGIEYEA